MLRLRPNLGKFVLVLHSVAIQANLNDERFVSNHQCIRVGGTKSPIALETREFRSERNQCKVWHAKPLILLRYYSPGELDVAIHVQNAGDIESIPVGTVSKVSGAIRQL